MGYASIADLATYGIPASAFGTLTDAQKLGALDAASSKVDSFLRGRYALPLLGWGTEITEATVVIAVWQLINVRGFRPDVGSDVAIRDRYALTIEWLGRVQRQAAHPNVTPTSTVGYVRPTVISRSALGTGSSATGTNRGW